MSQNRNSEVEVYILTSDPNALRTVKAGNLFSSRLFNRNVVTISPPADAQPTPGMNLDQFLESYRVQWCLQDARNKSPSNSVIILKDTSVSNANTDRISEIVSEVLKDTDWDLCYLCKWMDRCDLYSNEVQINGLSTHLVKTQSPHGIQALMFSPSGRDIVLGLTKMNNDKVFTPVKKPLSLQLNEAISAGNISAKCVVPNLIEYDILSASNPKDYLKAAECVVDSASSKSNSFAESSSGISWWWFIIIVLLIIFIVWLFLRHKKSSA